MAVKTITIDMEAYNLLTADKGPNESFSSVIKRRFRKSRTAADLLAHLSEFRMSESMLRATEKLIRTRS